MQTDSAKYLSERFPVRRSGHAWSALVRTSPSTPTNKGVFGPKAALRSVNTRWAGASVRRTHTLCRLIHGIAPRWAGCAAPHAGANTMRPSSQEFGGELTS